MNLSDVGIVCGVSVSLLTPTGIGLKYYADHEYVTIASQNLNLLYAVEDEMAEIQVRINNGTATSADMVRMATLKERKKHLVK